MGFGEAYLARDGKMILDGEGPKRKRWIRFRTAERMASKAPDHDWRVILHGPMHGETYQRQGKNLWLLVEKNRGFA